MAQTKERTQPEAKSPPRSAQRAPAPAPSAKANSTTPRSSWLARLRGPLTNAPGPDGQPRQRVGGTIFKSFTGILIWFVASQLVMYGLLMLDSALTKPGSLPPLETTHLFPPNTPLLGGLTPFLLLYGAVVIGFWFLLIRLNLIPRDFFGARAQARERERRQAGATTSTGASTGPRKTRTQRRHAVTQTSATNTGKGTAKGTAKGAAKPAARATEPQKIASTANGEHDDEYDRVRAAERLRRRRESKR